MSINRTALVYTLAGIAALEISNVGLHCVGMVATTANDQLSERRSSASARPRSVIKVFFICVCGGIRSESIRISCGMPLRDELNRKSRSRGRLR